MKKNIKYILLIITLVTGIFSYRLSFAQDAPPDGGFDDPDEIPIDGGVSLLAAAGVAYGVKKVRDKRKKPS